MRMTGVQNGISKHQIRNLETYLDNDALILKTIELDPGLNKSQISAKTDLTRRIVRNHLVKLQDKGRVEQIGGGFFLAGASSAELNESVVKAVRRNAITPWDIPFVRNVAGCYCLVNPGKDLNVFHDLFRARVYEFRESGFWLQEILVHAIRYGFLSRRVYSKKERRINRRLLRKGWERCFGDAKLLFFAYAISPPDFLRYLSSPRGISWAERIVETMWDSIMDEVNRNPVSRTARTALQMSRDGMVEKD